MNLPALSATEDPLLRKVSRPNHPSIQNTSNVLRLLESGSGDAACRGVLGQLVLRAPSGLRMHSALEGLDPSGIVGGREETRLGRQPLTEPIRVTKSGTILTGVGPWRLAVFEGLLEVECIEYPISDEDSLPFILTHHQPRPGWNAYVRICAALTMKHVLQQRALDNMRAGGKCKGWATLPDASRMNVRHEIATIAGTGSRNVSYVEQIRETAHPRLTDALRKGNLTINRAVELCKYSKAEQLERLIRESEDREIRKVIRRSIATPKDEKIDLDVVNTLEALLQQEAERPGSVEIRVSNSPRTVVIVGRDLLSGMLAQRRLI